MLSNCDQTFLLSYTVPRLQFVNRPFFHLRNIGFIHKYLAYDAAKIIIHAFVVSKLDYCNSLLYGLPSYLIQKLQHVQNSAARLVNQCPRFCHITPVVRDLHWLPVSFRIEFKIMLITYKVLHERTPIYRQELLQLHTPSRNLIIIIIIIIIKWKWSVIIAVNFPI